MVAESSRWKVTNQSVPQSAWTSAALSAVLALMLVIEIGAISADGYYQTKRLLAPKRLADRAEAAIREHYPEVRAELLAKIHADSPMIAERISRRLLAATPDARQQLEQLTSRQLDAGLDQITDFSREQFQEMLARNHDTIESAFQQIEQAPEEAHRLVLQTESSLEEQLGVDLQRQASQVLGLHRNLNQKLEHLLEADASLDSKELLERRIVRILRAIQEREAPMETANAGITS